MAPPPYTPLPTILPRPAQPLQDFHELPPPPMDLAPIEELLEDDPVDVAVAVASAVTGRPLLETPPGEDEDDSDSPPPRCYHSEE